VRNNLSEIGILASFNTPKKFHLSRALCITKNDTKTKFKNGISDHFIIFTVRVLIQDNI